VRITSQSATHASGYLDSPTTFGAALKARLRSDLTGARKAGTPVAGLTHFALDGPAAATVNYSMYRDPTRLLVWGDTVGVDTLASIGTGVAVPHIVYGREARERKHEARDAGDERARQEQRRDGGGLLRAERADEQGDEARHDGEQADGHMQGGEGGEGDAEDHGVSLIG